VALLLSAVVWAGGAWAQDLQYSGWPRQAGQDHPKIQKFLVDLIAEARASQSLQLQSTLPSSVSGSWEEMGMLPYQLEGNQVQVVIEAVSAVATSQIAQKVQALGGRTELTYEAQLQAFVPVEALEELAKMSEVIFIRLPVRPKRTHSDEPLMLTAQGSGSVVSEGVSVIGADDWQQAGVRGEGVKIGISDSGFRGYAAQLGRELPARDKVVTRSFRSDRDLECRNCSEGQALHGLAVAEVVHDVAPAASLYLTNWESDVEARRSLDWLIEQKVNVINASWAFYSGCFRAGGGIFEPQIAKVRQNGILLTAAAGNEGDVHYEASFQDTNSNNRHEFASGDEVFNLDFRLFEAQVQGQRVAAIFVLFLLSWDADCTNATDDYNIFLFPNSDPSFRQNSDWLFRPGVPIKIAGGFFFIQDPSFIGKTDKWSVLIEKRRPNAPSARLDVVVVACFDCIGGDFNYLTPTGSVNIEEPSISPNAMTVGAAHQSPTRCPRSLCPDGRLLVYSSQGPTKDGRIKPDIAAPTHVSTATFGRFTGHSQGQNAGFGGTSAAAPHVAGAAALVQQAFPDFTPEKIQQFLESRAEDSGEPGKDNRYGAGILFMGQPPVPRLGVEPESLSFQATEGESDPPAQTLRITNTGGGTLNWQAAVNAEAPWLSLAAMEGTAPSEVAVTAAIAGLAAGTYEGRITITAAGALNSPVTVPVTLTVERKAPQPSPLRAEPESLSFEAVVGEDNPAAQMLRLSFPSMGGSAVWKASVDAPWLMVDPAEGDLDFGASMDLSVSVEIAGLSAGTYNGRISFAVEGFEPLIVPVTLTLRSRPSTGELLVLAFKQLEFVNAGDWERTQREGCVIYTNVSDKPSLLRVTLPDDSVREFNIAAGKEVIVCGDVVHIDTR